MYYWLKIKEQTVDYSNPNPGLKTVQNASIQFTMERNKQEGAGGFSWKVEKQQEWNREGGEKGGLVRRIKKGSNGKER